MTTGWSYAADLRVESIKAWVDGALAYQQATTALMASEVSGGTLVRAKRIAVRDAVATASRAVDESDLTLDDALDASVDHAELVDRFAGLESAARRSYEEARTAYATALRNVDNGSAMLVADALQAPERAHRAYTHATDVERRAAACDMPVQLALR